MTRTLIPVLVLTVVAVSAFALEQGGMPDNPFFATWETPFGVPPFPEITDEHYLSAFEEGIRRTRQEVEAITASSEEPSFANTVEALEQSGQLLDKVRGVFFNLLDSTTNDKLQETARTVAPKLTALADDIALNEQLFARIKAVYAQREQLELGSEQRRLLEEVYRHFLRGGANLGPQDKARLRKINEQLSLLALSFAENVLKETNKYRLVITDPDDLSGLPDSLVTMAAETATKQGMGKAWVFTLQAPSIWPFLSYADNRELRREILTAYLSRCSHGDELDNRANVSTMAALRAEKAHLLGYPTHAHLMLEDRMAHSPEQAYGLLWRLWIPALGQATKEAAALQAAIEADGHDFQLQPWDWRYYTEKLRKQNYAIDEEEVRAYFELERVIEGVFELARRLYGLTFVKRDDLPTYHPEVRAFEVLDGDGSHIGVLLLDYHPRESKRGGAWENAFRKQYVDASGVDVRPVIVNVGNISRPTKDAPSLLRLEEVNTLFHEFGHGLHDMLSRCHYRSLSGTSVAWDFVELPSQIMENWVLEPEMLKLYARHYQTGEVMPDELVERLQEAARFNQGFRSVEFLAAAFLDLDWHTLTEVVEHDQEAFERQSLTRIGLPKEIPVRYRSPYFNHIFGSTPGYSAGYYSYAWAEVLDADAFVAFKQRGIFDRATAQAFRSNILEKGNTGDANELYRRFRGADPRVEPLLERLGFQ